MTWEELIESQRFRDFLKTKNGIMVFNLRGSDNMTNEEIEKIITFKNIHRARHKRCKYCEFLKFVGKIDYGLGLLATIYECMYTDKELRTDDIFWNIKGCFCPLYKRKEVKKEDL